MTPITHANILPSSLRMVFISRITKKLIVGTAKWLAPPSDGRKIPTTSEKTQYDPMDNNSNGIPVKKTQL